MVTVLGAGGGDSTLSEDAAVCPVEATAVICAMPGASADTRHSALLTAVVATVVLLLVHC